jgi:hypothetical protein
MTPRSVPIFVALSGLLLFAGHLGAEETALPVRASAAEGIGGMLPSQFRFNLAECTYLIEQNGDGNRKCKGGESLKFRVPLGTKGDVVWLSVSFLPYGKDLILVYDIQNDQEDYAAASVVRLNGSTLKIKWRVTMNPNSCPCVRENGSLYVAAWGFVGKIDLDRGRYVWSHDGKKRGFGDIESFKTLRIEGNDVLFLAEGNQGVGRAIRVDRATGKLVSVK